MFNTYFFFLPSMILSFFSYKRVRAYRGILNYERGCQFHTLPQIKNIWHWFSKNNSEKNVILFLFICKLYRIKLTTKYRNNKLSITTFITNFNILNKKQLKKKNKISWIRGKSKFVVNWIKIRVWCLFINPLNVFKYSICKLYLQLYYPRHSPSIHRYLSLMANLKYINKKYIL